MQTLTDKLDLQDGMRVWVINAPPVVTDAIRALDRIEWKDGHGEADYIHLFATHSDTLYEFLSECVDVMADKGILWVSWPKKSARVPGDLDRETVREIVLETGLVDIKVCAVDDVWSALKFVHRKSHK